MSDSIENLNSFDSRLEQAMLVDEIKTLFSESYPSLAQEDAEYVTESIDIYAHELSTCKDDEEIDSDYMDVVKCQFADNIAQIINDERRAYQIMNRLVKLEKKTREERE